MHETVERSLTAHPELRVRRANVPLQHYGFLKEDGAVEAKLQRYYERNREYREAHPEDAMAWYNEALHLQNEGREFEAARMLERAIELDPSFLSPRSQLALIHQEQAVRLWSALAERTTPDHPVHRVALEALQMLYRVTPGKTPIGKAREELLR